MGVVVADPEIVTVLRIFYEFLSCRSEAAFMSWLFPAESHSSGGFLFHELVIPGGKTILQVDSSSMS
jgi:hypothetical protein